MCTDFVLQSEDGTQVNGRSMEFAIDLQVKLRVHLRKEKRKSFAHSKKEGFSWTSRYGYVAITVFDSDYAVDGLNEKGLSVGALWLPGSQYETIDLKSSSKALSVLDVVNWMLANFQSTEEVEKALLDVRICGGKLKELGDTPPLHFSIHDRTGKSIVLELIDGEKKIHKNSIGVLTNAPDFEWHIKNLGNYLNLSRMSAEPVNLNGTVLSPPGQGSGLLGIPGDWMPSSRFVRMAAFKQFAAEPKDSKSAVNLAFHLLNTVDIPFGANMSKDGRVNEFDFTQWAVVKDLKNLKFYFRTYDNLNIRLIDFDKLNFKSSG